MIRINKDLVQNDTLQQAKKKRAVHPLKRSIIKHMFNHRMCEMKYYDEMKAEMETMQPQMAEAKKNERVNAPK